MCIYVFIVYQVLAYPSSSRKLTPPEQVFMSVLLTAVSQCFEKSTAHGVPSVIVLEQTS